MESDLFADRSPFGKLEQDRRARLLMSITRFLFVITGPIVLSFIILYLTVPGWQSFMTVFLSLMWIPIGLLVRRLGNKGRPELGGYLLISYFFILVGSNGILIRGLFPAVAPVYAAFIIMSGMVIGPAGTYYMGALGSCTWLAGWWISTLEIIRPLSTPGSLLALLVGVVVVCAFLFVGFMSQLATSDLRQALKDATYDLVQANRELNRANRLKSQFMARTSHELRTPLNAIIGFTDLTLRKIYGPLTQLQEDGMKRVLLNAKRLLALINDILDLSKIEAGELTLHERLFPISNLVEAVDISLAKKAQEKGLEFSIALAPDFPPYIMADENRLIQILLNLADNALKFTDTGHVSISIENLQPDHWIVCVRDSGRGIREEDQERMFEEFHQLDYTSTDSKSHGTGLGLAITRFLVEQMKGEIHVDSKIGKGTEFKVTFPLKLAATELRASSNASERAAVANPGSEKG